ncbi:hypothetical protein AZE42_04280 [Rhizopogon vesiculosus]|uniref:WD40 repeat-like protein n=1 Tax=Rhizopogon vesiculosus TaxID=180088 RepID=A0A1J8QRF9_9AGAM|nr:hypothetical protein AZE42_04280 [Rhizopogon vesiculosus]
MLALVTTTALTLASPVTLKNPPTLLPTSQHLLYQYFASAWSPDNSYLYLASPFRIDRFFLSESRLEQGVYMQSREEEEITAMAMSASGSIVLGIGRKVLVVECATGTTKVLKTFESHATNITALAVSNDSTLIASASSKGVHIHDLLVPAKHTSLHLSKSVPRSVSTLMFHPHVRTRLLLGSGYDVLVYDVAKPSAPTKTISIGQDVVGIACSPFSKSLVAVASTGSVNLVDLDKEKGLFKTVLSPEPIASIIFTPEGAAIYIGIRDGLRILNLRELDKEMKKVSVAEAGQGVVCLAIQKRLKNAPTSASAGKSSISNPSATSSPVRVRAKPALNMRSPLRPVTDVVPRKNVISPIKSSVSGTPKKQGAVEAGTPTKRLSSRGAFSPLRNSLSPGGRGTGNSGVFRTRVSTSQENIFDDAHGTSARPGARAPSSQKSGLLGIRADPGESISTRLASLRMKETKVASGSSARSEITRTSSNLGVGAKNRGPSLTRAPSTISISSSKTRDTARSKTPANEDEDIHTDLSSRGSKGKGKGKEADLEVDHDADACEESGAAEEDKEDAAQQARERELSMQVSPRRPTATTWVPSPLRPSANTLPMHSGASGAYELFRGLIADMQEKNHADIKALHIDMLRMGRGLRQEMEEWGGEVKRLREENAKLREENDKLRRGY